MKSKSIVVLLVPPGKFAEFFAYMNNDHKNKLMKTGCFVGMEITTTPELCDGSRIITSVLIPKSEENMTEYVDTHRKAIVDEMSEAMKAYGVQLVHKEYAKDGIVSEK